MKIRGGLARLSRYLTANEAPPAAKGDLPPPVDSEIAAREKLFRSPPLTRELAGAIHLISPHLNLEPNEAHRLMWENDQNSACWAEFDLIGERFGSLPQASRVLEIGPGMGRSLVFFSRKLGWENMEIHAYEANGKRTKYTDAGRRFRNSFCGNIPQLTNLLSFNGVTNVTIHDAQKLTLAELPGPFDLVYSFYAIGFHWALEHFMDDLALLLGKTGTGIFTVSDRFTPFPRLDSFSWQIISGKSGWKQGSAIRLIVISNKPFPISA